MGQLEHFEHSIKQAISAAHTGTLSTEHAVMLLADAGGMGGGTVRVGARDANVVEFLYSFDTGLRTVGNFFAQNDSYLVVTADRKYIVSKQHRLGDPLQTQGSQHQHKIVHLWYTQQMETTGS
jgi:hypothetical protein